jgi:hypothetical protein
LETYWKVQNRSYSYSKILISFATLPITDLCKLKVAFFQKVRWKTNRTFWKKCTFSRQPNLRFQKYRSCQWLGPVSVRPVTWSGLGLKIGCAFKILCRKKIQWLSSKQQKNSTTMSCTAKKQARHWEFEPGKTIILMAVAIFHAAKYRGNSGIAYKAPCWLMIQPIESMLRGHTQIWASTDFWAGR